jgi:serine/threonine protein kinase
MCSSTLLSPSLQCIGILHLAIKCASIPSSTIGGACAVYGQLACALLPHSAYKNTAMLASFDESPSMQRTPWHIAALCGNHEILNLLESFGCRPSHAIHANDIRLRQLMRQYDPSYPLPIRSYLDFEVDNKSRDTIPQGHHSMVAKAHVINNECVNNDNNNEVKKAYAIKIIEIASSDNSLSRIAQQLTLLHQQSSIALYALSADDGRVSVVMDWLDGPRLDYHFPNLLAHKQRIINNGASVSLSSLSIDERRMMYICINHQFIARLIDLLHQLHSKQIIHRDVRAAKVMLHKSEATLIGFGRARRSSFTLTEIHSVIHENKDHNSTAHVVMGMNDDTRSQYQRIGQLLVDNTSIVASSRDTATSAVLISLIIWYTQEPTDGSHNDIDDHATVSDMTPPEVITGSPYTQASDIWALGIILLSIWTCQLPFEDMHINEVLLGLIHSSFLDD